MKNSALTTVSGGLRGALRRPPVAMAAAGAYVLGTSLLVANTPRSLSFFLLFIGFPLQRKCTRFSFRLSV